MHILKTNLLEIFNQSCMFDNCSDVHSYKKCDQVIL